MLPADAYSHISARISENAGRFYGDASSLHIGSGLIYNGIRYPIYVEQRKLFATIEGLVYVVTHECDIESDNERPFNNDVAVIPIIPFESFVEEFLSVAVDEDDRVAFLKNLAANRISRLTYLPPFGPCDYGGVMFLNQISCTKLESFREGPAHSVTALSEFGRRTIDWQLQNNFFRPTQPMPLHGALHH